MQNPFRPTVASLSALGALLVLTSCATNIGVSQECPCRPGYRCNEAFGLCIRDDYFDASRPVDGADPSVDDGPDGAIAESDSGETNSAPDGALDAASTGAPEAGPVDGGDPNRCSEGLSSAFICEDFESPPTDLEPYSENGVVDVAASSLSHGGTGALRVRTTAAGGRAALRSIHAPISSGEVWIRLYFYIPSSAQLSSISLLQLTENQSPWRGLSIGVGSDEHIGVYSTITERYLSDFDLLGFSRDAWQCTLLHVRIDPADGLIELFLNDSPAVREQGVSTRPDSGFGYFGVGIDFSVPEQMPLEVWVDDVAWSDHALRCP